VRGEEATEGAVAGEGNELPHIQDVLPCLFDELLVFVVVAQAAKELDNFSRRVLGAASWHRKPADHLLPRRSFRSLLWSRGGLVARSLGCRQRLSDG
jgi:hypothetical protein